MKKTSSLDRLAVDTIKMLAVDMVQQANSGHPGMPMGAAPMAYALWDRHLKHNPINPSWPDRDRFVLSAGHGCALLYSLLHLTGYDLSLDELKRFRQLGSMTPGHPERGLTPGVEATTGPLGQGIATAVGMAMAERFLAATFNRPGFPVFDHFTYVLHGDGCLEEGISSEAASLAGTLKLGRLICLYDDNHITIEGDTSIAFTEDVPARFAAAGWHVQQVADGHDVAAIDAAIAAAKAETSRPSIICVRTHIADGSPAKHDSASAHGNPLGEAEVAATKQAIGWPTLDPFHVPSEAAAHLALAKERGAAANAAWDEMLSAYRSAHPELAAELERALRGEWVDSWKEALPSFEPGGQIATRSASGKVLNAIAPRLPTLIGGSADLGPSTDTTLEGLGDFSAASYGGRTFHFGVREHGMAAALNGMALHGGVRPYGATFLSFADYCRASVRLAALMEAPSIFVFTHDSIGMGEDGPTHQPIEQLTSLRLIPNLTVIRPADATETAGAWAAVLEQAERPVALALTRQKVPVLAQSTADAVRRVRLGAYVLSEASNDRPELILLATGSEVHLAQAARETLERRGVPTRVVSMPSWELFNQQPAEYRERVIPTHAGGPYILAVEAGSPWAWYRYVGPNGDVMGLDRFGTSAPYDDVMREMGFTVEQVVKRALELVDRPHLIAEQDHHSHTLVGVGALAHEGNS
ncbi:MAG: transketolase [Chloroflexota bacterium]